MTTNLLDQDIRLALRGQLLTVVKATTGPLTVVSINGTTQKYSRTSGSFITDGIQAGDEAMVSGAALAGNNGASMVSAVTAADLTVVKTPALVTAAAGPAITIAVPLPLTRKWENYQLEPPTGRPYTREKLDFSNEAIRGTGAGGLVEIIGVYIVDLFYPADKGSAAIESMARAVMRALKPGTNLTRGTATVRITRTQRSGLMEGLTWAQVSVTARFFVHHLNT